MDEVRLACVLLVASVFLSTGIWKLARHELASRATMVVLGTSIRRSRLLTSGLAVFELVLAVSLLLPMVRTWAVVVAVAFLLTSTVFLHGRRHRLTKGCGCWSSHHSDTEAIWRDTAVRNGLLLLALVVGSRAPAWPMDPGSLLVLLVASLPLAVLALEFGTILRALRLFRRPTS